MKTTVSQIVLYVLSLIQTVSTVLFFTVEATWNITKHFFCASMILVPLTNEFGGFFSVQTAIALVWLLLRISLLVLGIIGFRQRTPRKVAMILLAVTTGWELVVSFLPAMFCEFYMTYFLSVVMAVLCIKGFLDLREEQTASDRKALSPKEIDARVESLHDKLNDHL